MERALFTGNALDDQARGFVDKNAQPESPQEKFDEEDGGV
jgi:hypothetical protein